MKVKNKIIGIMLANILSYVVTFIMILLLALIMFKFQPEDTFINIMVFLTYFISNFGGGFYIGNKCESKKYIHGMICGVIYFIILLSISICLGGDVTNLKKDIWVFVVCVAGGMCGGMVRV